MARVGLEQPVPELTSLCYVGLSAEPPINPAEGDVYTNSTTLEVFVYHQGRWLLYLSPEIGPLMPMGLVNA